MAELVYTIKDKDVAAVDMLKQGLNEYAADQAKLERKPGNLYCYDGDKMVGGITSHLVGKTCSIKLLWVHPDYRKKKVGSELLKRLEDYAYLQGCIMSFVDTMSYQAPGFYLKNGYKEATRLIEFYEGHDRVFYKKKLG